MYATGSQADRRQGWRVYECGGNSSFCLCHQARCRLLSSHSCVLVMMVRILVACLGEWEGLQTLSHIVRVGAESIPNTQVSVKVVKSMDGENESRDEEEECCALRNDMETADAILLGISRNRDSGQEEENREDKLVKVLKDQIGQSSELAGKVGSAFAVFSMSEASEDDSAMRKQAERSIEKICNAFFWHGMILSGIPMNAHRSGTLSLANGVCARFDDQRQSSWPEEFIDENHISHQGIGNNGRRRNRLAHFRDTDIRNAFFQGQWTASIAWRLQKSAEPFRQTYEQSSRRTRMELRGRRPEISPVRGHDRNVEPAAERPQGSALPHIPQRHPTEEVTADSGDKNKQGVSDRRERKPVAHAEEPNFHEKEALRHQSCRPLAGSNCTRGNPEEIAIENFEKSDSKTRHVAHEAHQSGALTEQGNEHTNDEMKNRRKRGKLAEDRTLSASRADESKRPKASVGSGGGKSIANKRSRSASDTERPSSASTQRVGPARAAKSRRGDRIFEK